MTITVGDKVLLIPDGKGGYLAKEMITPAAGDKALLIPDGKGGYIVAKMGTPVTGDNVIVFPEKVNGHIVWKSETAIGTAIGTLYNYEDTFYQNTGGTSNIMLNFYYSNEARGLRIWQNDDPPFDYRAYFSNTRGFFKSPADEIEKVEIDGTVITLYEVFSRTTYLGVTFWTYKVEYSPIIVGSGHPVYIYSGFFKIRYTGIGAFPINPGDYFKINTEIMQAHAIYPDNVQGRADFYDIYIEDNARALFGTTKAQHHFGESIYLYTP